MEQENDKLESLLSEVVEQAQSEQIVYIDIDELEENPRNFYGLRDIEVLASLIAVSHLRGTYNRRKVARSEVSGELCAGNL